MKDFGNRLKELRTQHHLSQMALAEKLGVTAQAVSKWEKGRSTPDLEVIVPMAKLFHISTDQLLGYEGPRQDWEQRWDHSMREGNPSEARRIAVEAQKELPELRHLRYRQAQAEAMMANKTEDREERQQLLVSAERLLREILNEYPEFEGAAMSLASVLLRQGRRQEAEAVAMRYPNGLFILIQLLRGEATEEMKLRAITARAAQFQSILIESGDLRALDLAERFLEETPWDPRDRAGLLSILYVNRAFLLCEKGDPDGTLAALERMRTLMKPISEEEAAGPKGALTFLRFLPGLEPEAEWVPGLSLLKDPRLKTLEEREEFRALLALAEKHSPAGGT